MDEIDNRISQETLGNRENPQISLKLVDFNGKSMSAGPKLCQAHREGVDERQCEEEDADDAGHGPQLLSLR